MNDEIGQIHTVSLYKRHINYLDEINENRSLALRTILDSIINGKEQTRRKKEQTRRKKILDNCITWACFGAIFLFISYILEPTPKIISILIGVFLFAYGAIGGIINAVQTTKRYK